MSVDDWARQEAARLYGQGFELSTIPVAHLAYAECWVHGATRVFDALLSDEAVRAAARGIGASDHPVGLQIARTALQAAISAVTKGDAHE